MTLSRGRADPIVLAGAVGVVRLKDRLEKQLMEMRGDVDRLVKQMEEVQKEIDALREAEAGDTGTEEKTEDGG